MRSIPGRNPAARTILDHFSAQLLESRLVAGKIISI